MWTFALIIAAGTAAVIGWIELCSALQRFCDALPNSIESYDLRSTPRGDRR